ncbi:MAG: hypothetical protein R2847_00580 [Bacteroidia bacterium]
MDHFGLKSAKDLPKLKDVVFDENEIGVPLEMQDATGDELAASEISDDENLAAENGKTQDAESN